MRVKGHNINFNASAPTKVSDMREGEIRITTDGIYARVGNQVLYESGLGLLPLLLTCGAVEDYYRMLGDDFHWTLDAEMAIADGVLTKTGTNPRMATWAVGPWTEGVFYENCIPFVLPLVTAEIMLTGTGSLCEDLFSIQSMHPVEYQPIQIKVADTSRNISIYYIDQSATYWSWVEGSGWNSGVATTGETWTLNEWWKLDVERNGTQWRISIKDEADQQVILTDWVEWAILRFEAYIKYAGNAGTIFWGEGDTGPHGMPPGQVRNFACCTGLRRFLYTDFSAYDDSQNWNLIFVPTTSGAGGTVTGLNDYFNLDMNGASGSPSILDAVQNFATTGELDLDEFDAWAKIHLPSGLTTEGEMYTHLLFTGYNSGGTHEAGLRLRWTGSQYQLEYRAVDASNTDDWTAVSGVTGINEIWVRFKFLPSEGDTEIEMYYSLVDPSVAYGGWKRVFPVTASPNMSNLVQASGADFEFRGYNNDSGSQSMWIEFLNDARRVTFLTTTTTTTTTTAPLTFDEFNDSSIGSWWTESTDRPWEMGVGSKDSPGGTAVEEEGLMKFQLPAAVMYGQYCKQTQNLQEEFDIYVKGTVLESGGGGTDGTELFFAVYDTKTQWGISFEYGYNQGSGQYTLYTWTSTTAGSAFGSSIGSFVPDTVWLRLRYRAGDAAPRMYYSFNSGGSWTEASVGPNDLTLTDFSRLKVEIVGRQYDSGDVAAAHFDFLRDGSGLTTTSTTTTTTTT